MRSAMPIAISDDLFGVTRIHEDAGTHARQHRSCFSRLGADPEYAFPLGLVRLEVRRFLLRRFDGRR